jgi:hypothetical protein
MGESRPRTAIKESKAAGRRKACEGRWRAKDDDEEMWRLTTTTIGELTLRLSSRPGQLSTLGANQYFSARGDFSLFLVLYELGPFVVSLSLSTRSRDLEIFERSLQGCLHLSTRPSHPPTLSPPGRLQPTARSQRKCRRPTFCYPPLRLTLQLFGVTARVQTGANLASGLRRSPRKVGDCGTREKSRKKPCDAEFPTYVFSAGWNRVLRASLFQDGFSPSIAGAQCGRSVSTWLDEPRSRG